MSEGKFRIRFRMFLFAVILGLAAQLSPQGFPIGKTAIASPGVLLRIGIASVASVQLET